MNFQTSYALGFDWIEGEIEEEFKLIFFCIRWNQYTGRASRDPDGNWWIQVVLFAFEEKTEPNSYIDFYSIYEDRNRLQSLADGF